MGCQENLPRTFVLKLNLHCYCQGCVTRVKKLVLKIQGVDSIKIEGEEAMATISGNVDPHRVIKELEKDKTSAQLLGEEEESPPQVNKQDNQIVVRQNSVRKILDQRKVAPQQLPDLIVKPIDNSIAKKIQDFYRKHDHELELRSYNKPFKCDGCMEDGFRWRYRCEPCNYDLHEECMYPKPTITHELFQGSTFIFRDKPGNICDACGREIRGYSYHCKADDLDLHPRCSNLKGKLCIGGTDFVLRKKAKNNCFWCKKKKPTLFAENNVEGWCYVSECNKFYCHVYCVSQMVHEAWKRGDLDRNDADDDDDTSLALEKVDLKLVAKSTGSGGGGSVFLKTISIFLKTIVGILFGDPTVLILSMLVEIIPR